MRLHNRLAAAPPLHQDQCHMDMSGRLDSPTSTKPATGRFGVLALLGCLVLQWAVYYDSFAILSASDDFPIVNEIHRGNAQGASVFFTDSVIVIGYRPLKSLAIWGMGNLFWPN